MAKFLLALHQFFPRFYTGTETLALETAQKLVHMGHEVVIFTAEPLLSGDFQPDVPSLDKDAYEDIPVWRLITPVPGDPVERLDRESDEHPLSDLFDQLIEMEQPDGIYLFHPMRLTVSFVRSAREHGIPVYFVATDFWMLCPTYQLIRHNDRLCRGPVPADCFACLLALYGRGMAVAPLKYRIAIRFPRLSGLIHKGARRCRDLLETRIHRHREMMGMFDGVFWSNTFLRDLFHENGLRSEAEHLVPFPVPEKAKSMFSLPPPDPDGSLEVAFIGTLKPAKGPQVLIAAMERIDRNLPVRLTIWGKEEYPGFEDQLRERVGGDGRVRFAGTFPQEAFSEVLEGCHVVVIPSLWYENTPLTALSVLAAGRALVASDLGGLAAAVRNGNNGLLFAPGDDKALAEILIRLARDRDFFSGLVSNIDPPQRVETYVKHLLSAHTGTEEGAVRAAAGS